MTIATKELQLRVAGWYPGIKTQVQLAIDGNSMTNTFTAVRNFQRLHGLVVDGIAGPRTEAAINVLHNPDNSTQHFDWLEFKKPRDTSSIYKLPLVQVVYNLRMLMWNLEGLRSALGNVRISINSGVRSIAYNKAIGGASDSMHMYGLAADISVRDKTPMEVTETAKKCGFSGIFLYPGHTHVDLRARFGRPWVWQ